MQNRMFSSKKNPKKKQPRGPFREPEGDLARARSPVVPSLIGIYLFLTVFGLVNLYSASLGGSFFYSQLNNTFVGMILFVIFGWIIPTRALNDYAYLFYGVVIVMLISVFFSGHVAGGSQRWIKLGPISGQPSEVAKLAVAVIVARYFHYQSQHADYRLRDLWPIAGLVGVIFLLVFEQPDLGTAGVCLIIAVIQIAMLRISPKSVFIAGSAFLVTAILGWFFFLHDYQKTRVLTLFNPDIDPTGKGYNSLQSLIAVGSGELFGKGFMQGTQTQLQFLPARHTDFVFSVFAEEYGFIIGALIFVLFGLLTQIALQIARSGRDTFSALLGVGIAGYIFIQFTINVAMVLAMFPVVGIPLPFFSHGGTSLMVISMALGILVSIHRSRMASMQA
jgi:rod shape determining protein RodA